MRRIDLTGRKFGEWSVVRYVGGSRWLCRCKCGREKTVDGYTLRKGSTTKCHRCASNKHGLSRTPEYKIWSDIKQRCFNPNEPNYKHYGARGIGMCQRWRNNFRNFLEDMGKRPSSKMQIDRIDVNGDYCPKNCRWVTQKENVRNTTRNRKITIGGEEKCLAEWCELYGKTYCCVSARLCRGWDILSALITPVNENIWRSRGRR